MAKEPAKAEVISDVNGNVVNFYKVLRSRLPELQKALSETLHSRETYKHAMVIYSLPWLFDDLQKAWAFWVCTQMGFKHMVGSWAFDKVGKTAKALRNNVLRLDDSYAERLRRVTIECIDACMIIERFDNETTFHYVDPPCLNCDQGHYAGYTEDDFKRLLNTLETVKGKFLISSYPHPLLVEYAAKNGWEMREIEMHLSASSKAGKKKVEVLTGNYAIS